MPAKLAKLGHRLQLRNCVLGEVDLMVDKIGLLVEAFSKSRMWCSGHESKEARVRACT